jgi:uncharacterized protein (DUF302 family)
MKHFAIITLMVTLLFSVGPAFAEKYGTFVKVSEHIEGTFDEAVKNSEDALKKSRWDILASYSDTVPEGCTFRAHTIVVNSPDYAQKVMSHGPRSSFALPLRVSIYEDETGINVAFANPASLNRTVLGDAVATELSINTMNALSEILASAVKGKTVNAQIGEIRKKGKVGGMGGGHFRDMIEVIYKKEDKGNVFQDITRKVKEGIESNQKAWKLLYALQLDSDNAVLYGINQSKMEAKAYKIAGEKRESEKNLCPGIDHTASFPIEVAVYKEMGMVKVAILDGMYRMKVYFEDAGMWAFMKNMGMPGEIQEEIVAMSLSKLQ